MKTIWLSVSVSIYIFYSKNKNNGSGYQSNILKWMNNNMITMLCWINICDNQYWVRFISETRDKQPSILDIYHCWLVCFFFSTGEIFSVLGILNRVSDTSNKWTTKAHTLTRIPKCIDAVQRHTIDNLSHPDNRVTPYFDLYIPKQYICTRGMAEKRFFFDSKQSVWVCADAQLKYKFGHGQHLKIPLKHAQSYDAASCRIAERINIVSHLHRQA